ncbi:MAG: thiamine phosphate synthase [Gammaproteobacteria bacterium]|nr:thiamine phosphate synthase [Gammaproteobacteria bacterium]MBU1624664.1 thiamine phosphate synthase [Gammaproteobacteria bacterium]MBU1982508.1 thiamine phosphate synthase [Gammaproteobacteria bacterium]
MTQVRRPVIKGLYAITPDELDTAKLLQQVECALRGGAAVLQYRNKLADAVLQQKQASALREMTRRFGTTFIVNDDVQLALKVFADGVHLGADDGDIAAARAVLGRDKLIGASCYNRAPLAREAVRQGADYVAFGAFFSSSVKPGAVAAEVSMLENARRELKVHIVAIGGITLENGKQLVTAGTDALAVISALWQAPDIEQAAKEFSQLFEQGNPA